MKFRIHDKAVAEFVDAAAWYEKCQAGLGHVFTDRVDKALQAIRETPLRFARLETAEFEGEVRRVLLSRFPYLVIYEVHDDRVTVLAVAHASRSPDYWLERSSEE